METEKQLKVPVYKQNCPVCGRPTILARSVAESHDIDDSALWYFCLCGVVFQEKPHVPELKDNQYILNHKEIKEYDDISIHLGKTYGSIIEEATYGRKMLDVGFSVPNNMNFFKERGWITWGIDNNKDIKETDYIINDDFETTEKLYKGQFDLVWMAHILEKFQDPIRAIYKAKEILEEGGVLFIETPDIDFMHTMNMSDWQHWKRKENYIMWSERALCRELEKAGFNILVKYRNYYKRFGYYHNLHIVAQKIYY